MATKTTLFISRFLIVFSFLFSFISISHASHVAGGEITYNCVGPNQYQVTLVLYRDCNGITLSNTEVINYRSTTCGVNSSLSLALQTTVDITPLCPTAQSACNGGSGTFGVERIVYTGILNLPPGCTDWILSYQMCCRNNSITNVSGASSNDFYVQTTLNNTVSPCNSSPTFSNNPQLFACVGQTINFQQLATDPDGDVLVYSLVNAMNSSGSSVTYGGGFNGLNPFTVPCVIDPVTGQITFTPDVTQVAVVAVLVQEYRNGVLIGSVMRDIQFNIINCTNTIPTISGIDGVAGDFDITACVGAPLCFDINSTDIDAVQNILVTYSNNIPGATFTQSGTGNSVSGTFCWNTTIADTGTHVISISVQDNACPLIGQNSQTYTINIVPNPNPPVIAGADITICAGNVAVINASSAAPPAMISGYSWTPTSTLSDPNNLTTNATPTTTTSYTINMTYTDGCSSSDAITVIVANDPVASVFPGSANVCGGANFLLTGSTDQAGMVYEWFDPSMVSLGTGTVSGTNSTIIVTAPVAAGSYNYTFQVTNPLSGCSSQEIAVLIVGSPPVLPSCVNIYASTTGNALAPGTQASPTTLTAAIAMASCNNAVIKLATGTYNIDNPLYLSSFITIEGGFQQGSAWTKTSTPGATTINRTTLNPEGAVNAQRLVAFYGNSLSEFRLQDLTVTTANANLPGMSTYGIHLTNCSNYNIVRTQVLPGSGAAGAAGVTGTIGIAGRNGGNGSAGDIDDEADAGAGGGGGGGGGTTLGNIGANATGNFNSANNCSLTGGAGGIGGLTAGNGGNGANDANGCGCCANGTTGVAGATSTNNRSGGGGGGGGSGGEENGSGGPGAVGGGVFGVFGTNNIGGNGGAESVDGGVGGNGTAGPAGTIGAAGPAGSHVAGFWMPGTQAGTGTDGRGGQGGRGGGGGGGQGCAFCIDGSGSGGGGGGGGGQGGSGGTGGFGGGSSFGVYLTNNGAGGNLIQDRVVAGAAGAGGTGGSGGTGGTGGTGGLGSPYGGSEVGGGGNGGNGGTGGAGGNGGAGQAGIAINVYLASGSALVSNDNAFNLAAQPVIQVSNVNCTNTNVTYSTAAPAAWDFDIATNFATPATAGAVSPTITQYSAIDRYSILMGPNTYTGFHNIAFMNTIAPNILTNAPIVAVDTFSVCQGEFATFQSEYYADTYTWNFNGAIADPGNVQLVNSAFNTPGFYTITMNMTTDCCGQTPNDTVYLYVIPVSTATGSGNASICENENAVLTLTGIQPTDIVVWTPTLGVLNTTPSELTVSPAVTTTYTASIYSTVSNGITSISGCPISIDFVVTVNSLPTINTSSVPLACLSDGSATATASSPGSFDFVWSTGATNNGVSTSTINGISTGTYTVTMTDPLSGCFASEDIFVYPSPTSPVVYVQSSTTTCQGQSDGSVTLTTSGGTAPYTYLWNGVTTIVSSTPITQSNLAGGSYTVNVTDALGCESDLIVEISEIDLPEYLITFNGPICAGEDAIFSVSGGDGVVLTYNIGAGNTTIILDHDSVDIIIPGATTNQTLTAVSVNGSCLLTLNTDYTIIVNPEPQVTVNDEVCYGTDYTFPDGVIHTNIIANESYVSTLTTVAGCDSIITTQLTVNPIYSLSENINACENSSVTYPDGSTATITGNTSYTSNLLTVAGCDSIIVTNVTMDPVYNIVQNISACENSTVTYPDGATEVITGNTNHTSNLFTLAGCDSTIVTNVTMNPVYALSENINICENSSVTYPDGSTATITGNTSYTSNLVTVAGCDSVIVTNVTMDPLPISGTNGAISFCPSDGQADLFNSLGGSPETAGTWSPAMTSGTGVFDPALDPAGTYSYTVTNLCGSSSSDVVVTMPTDPNPGTNGAITYCGNDTGSDLFNELGGTPDAGGVWSPVLASGSGMFNPAVDPAGTYSYSITTSCGVFSADVVVTVNPILTTVIDNSICSGTDYTYPDGTIQTNITANVSYTSTLVALNGCDSLVVTNLTIIALPTATINGGNSYCTGDVVNDILVTVSGTSSWTVDYELDGVAQTATGASSPISLGNAVGTYVLTGISDGVCTNSASGTATISVNPIPAAPAAGVDSTYCSSEILAPMTASGVSGASFTWYSDGGSVLGTSNQFTPLTQNGVTNYYVTQTVLGCEGPSSVVIITVNGCDIIIPTAFTPNGDGANDNWQIVDLDELYPNNAVRIYNRWGNLLFEHDSSKNGPYDSNRWEGTYKGSDLPVGSYYFIIDLNDTEDARKGIVSIIKN